MTVEIGTAIVVVAVLFLLTYNAGFRRIVIVGPVVASVVAGGIWLWNWSGGQVSASSAGSCNGDPLCLAEKAFGPDLGQIVG